MKRQVLRHSNRRRDVMLLAVAGAALILAILASLQSGYSAFSPADLIRTLMGKGSGKENLVLFSFRAPRTLLAVMVGSGLAVSGCVLQGVTGNALADPGILGINAGAGLAVVLYVMLFGTGAALSVFTLPLMALAGAGLAACCIYLAAHQKGAGVTPLRMVLSGVALQAGFSALTTFLAVKMDDTQYNFVSGWQAGSIWGANATFVLALLPWLSLLFPVVFIKARILDMLALGDETATGLGIDVPKERVKLLVAAVAIAGACVSVSGSISFVGLIAPHIARRLCGGRHRVVLPLCAVLGGVLVCLADTIARVIIQPSSLPAGVVVSVLGAPYFLFLLTRRIKGGGPP